MMTRTKWETERRMADDAEAIARGVPYLTAAMRRVLSGMVKGEAKGEGGGWSRRGMRAAYYYPGDGYVGQTLPRVFSRLERAGLVEASAGSNDSDTMWTLTSAGRRAV